MPTDTRVHAVQFHLYEVQEEAEAVCGEEVRRMGGGAREMFKAQECLHLDLSDDYKRMHI